MTLQDENAELKRRLAAAEASLRDNGKLDEVLRESEARHRLLIESWAQAVWETDPAGVVVADSPSWRAYTGQTLDEWLGYGWLNAIHPDDRAFAERQWRDATAARRLVDAEFRLRAPDGVWRWTNVRAAPVLDEAGNIEKWAGINIDIHDRKRAEAALLESEERYRAVFESIDEGFVEMEMVIGDAGQVVDWRWIDFNPAFERMSGLKGKKGQLFSEVVPDLEPEWAERYGHVIATGETLRFELPVGGLDSWFDAFVSRIGAEGSRRLVVVFNNITARKRAEEALRESEKRQAFLLKLSDLLRSFDDAEAIKGAATRAIGEHLGVDRAMYGDVDEETDELFISALYCRPGVSPIPQRFPIAGFGPAAETLRTGQLLDIPNTGESPGQPQAVREAFQAMGIGATLGMPLVKAGRWVSTIGLQTTGLRAWTESDAMLLRETGERTWAAVERARAETALRASEERFAQFAKASSAGIWIRDAKTLAMEFASPAISTIYGVPIDAILGDMANWAAMIVPEDRDIALGHVAAARRGESVVHEFRIQRPSDRTFRWIRNTDFPLGGNGHPERVGGIAEDVTEQKLAVEHQSVLLLELQHRVRNIMALIRSLTARTGERAASVQDYTELMLGRLMAFARVQALLTRAANVSVGISSIVHDEVSVQAQHEGQYVIDGPDIELSPKAAEVLTLAVHELATNAVKYGALSGPNGKVTVSWSTFEKRGGTWLAFDWIEAGAPPRPATDGPRRRGFGSELIEGRVPYELKGKGAIAIELGGARCHLEFPLGGGASILETGAPQRATVFGGALDMTGEPDLSGHRILVVEDDYYLATDTARALLGAGAQVMGPCGSEEDARAELDAQRPDAVILDINLGQGATFKLAEHLKDTGVPFVFTTGYDQVVIPAEFIGVERLEKPFQLRQVVNAAARLVGAAA